MTHLSRLVAFSTTVLSLSLEAFLLTGSAAAQTGSTAAVPSFVKLPLSINTPDQSELEPTITADGKFLYFARTRMSIDSEQIFDIWRSAVTNDTTYSDPEYLSGSLGSRFGVAVISVSPDNNSLYIIGKFKDDALPEERLYVTHRTATDWSIPEALHVRNLNPRGIYTDYTFGADQRTLVMAVDRDSTLGDRDLYVSFHDDKTGSWSSPHWLGSDINSRFAEMTPYLASDNRTLYFSSDRPGGFGDVDVYRSTRLDDSWQHWSKPENLGTSVNRPGRTSFYSEDAKGEYAYISWKPKTGVQSDIFRIRVSHSRAVALLHGTITDAAGKPILARVHYERLSDGKELGTARSNPTTGEYQIALPSGENYAIRAEKDGYFPTSENLDLRNLKAFERIEKNLMISKLVAGAAITLKNVFFETDRSTLLPTSYPELDRVNTLLTEHPDFKLNVQGHTDNVGSEAHNMQLAKDRANAVVAYLVSKGINASRLQSISFGPKQPIASNDTEEGRAQNRRVEFVLQASGTTPGQ